MKVNENRLIFIIFVLIFILQSFLIYSSKGIYGGADNINHFSIARYAVNHPWLLLDHWGKPVYTLLSLPFTFFGIQFSRLFNLLLGLSTIWFTIKILRNINEKFSFLIIFLVAFSPMYFLLMQSCMTEILFSFALIISIWLFSKGKPEWVAVVLSFIPFIRTEGVVVIPVFFVAFLFNKNYKAIPFLFLGSFLYTLVGYFHYHDWLWIVNQMPYSMGQSLYGSGSLFHFVKNSDQIFGIPFLIFFSIGLIVWTSQMVRSKFKEPSFWIYFLSAGSFIAFFAAHSYVWWKGTGGSLGLIRVIAGVIPVAAIVAVVGFNSVIKYLKNPMQQFLALSVVIVLQISVPFLQYDLPLQLDSPQELIKEVSTHIKNHEPNSKVYYFDPYLIHFLDKDPYNQNLSNWGIADKLQPSNSMKVSDILVWDAHFGPNEGGLQLENLLKDAHLQLLKAILPAEPFKVLGDYDYGIYIFKKVDQKLFIEKQQELTRELFFSNIPNEKVELVGDKKLYKLNEKVIFSPAIEVPVSEILTTEYIELTATAHYIPKEQLNADEVLLVVSFDFDHKNLSYHVKNMEAKAQSDISLHEISFTLKMNANFPEGTMLSIYVWNKDKKKLLLEDVKVIIKGY